MTDSQVCAASFDNLLDRTFSRSEYTCLHFTIELWRNITGEDIAGNFADLVTDLDKIPRIHKRHRRSFVEIQEPQTPCIAVMQKPLNSPHVGVYRRGKIFHITEIGVCGQRPNQLKFNFEKIRYFVPCQK